MHWDITFYFLSLQSREVVSVVDEEEDGVDVVIAVVEESTESISKAITVWLKHL